MRWNASFSFREHCLFLTKDSNKHETQQKHRFFKKKDKNLLLNKVNSLSNKIKPLVIYDDSLLDKLNALNNNIGKSAVYRWVHKINGKSYVGSSIDLYRSLRNYYNIDFLKRKILTSNSRIYRALLDNGYGEFNLEILEYCDKNILIEREQYYIDMLKPEYNKRFSLITTW